MDDVPDNTNQEIDAIKGFNLDWTCRGYQFEIGKTYTHEGDVAACESGFHAVENPIDAFAYYPPGSSRYAAVKQTGKVSRHSDDSKIASATITIGVEIKLHDMITRAVTWIISKAKPADVSHSDGNRSAASSTGYQSAASSTGDQSAASSTGDRSAAMSAGRFGRVMAAEGCALFLVHRDDDWNITHAWAGIAGQNGIKPLTWYTLGENGQPVECA